MDIKRLSKAVEKRLAISGAGEKSYYLVNKKTNICDFGPFASEGAAKAKLATITDKENYEIKYGYAKIWDCAFYK